jgi:hypothetical protein
LINLSYNHGDFTLVILLDSSCTSANFYIFLGEYDFKIWVKVMKTQKEVRIGLQRDVVVTVGRSQNSPDQKR